MSRVGVALSVALALSVASVDANDAVDALTSRLTTKTVRLERFATDLESRASNDYDEYAASSGYFALNRTTKDAHMFYTFFDARSRGAREAAGARGRGSNHPLVNRRAGMLVGGSRVCTSTDRSSSTTTTRRN